MIIMNQQLKLFDYIDDNGFNVMQAWADGMPMQKRDRGRLDSKIDLLAIAGCLPPGLVHPTKCRHIMHLVVRGEVTFCPMFCRGPFNNYHNECTFLLGATERDRKYSPTNADREAEKKRADLSVNPTKRCNHERFTKLTQEVIP